MEPIVLTHHQNRVGYITLNRPEKRNALSPELISALSEAFAEMEKNPTVKVVLLQAKGRAFCAGADLDYLKKLQDFSIEENQEDSRRLMDLFNQIYEFPKVVIAQVEGHAMAGGCGLVSLCDFAFAVPDALFGYTEVRIGFVPALVSVFLVEQLGQAKATELLLSGELISAKKAAEFELITEVIDEDLIEDWVRKFANRLITENSEFSMRETKRLLRSLGRKNRLSALEAAADANAQARSHQDCVKGLTAFLQKNKPNW